MNDLNSLNVGLIGFGMAGQVFHAPMVLCVDNLHLTTIQTTNKSNIEIAAKKYPNAQIISETSALLARDDIDLIIVATPNHTHFELAKAALEANKHVVVDKPFTASSAEAAELTELAASRKKILSVHQNRRWDGDFLTIRKILDKQFLGRLVEAEIHYDRFRPTLRENTWKEENSPGTGILYDLGSHLIDQAQVLFGLPKTVTADIRKQRTGSEIADNFEVVLDYEKIKVTLKAGLLVREPLPHYILLGEKGSFVKYGMDVQEAALNAGQLPCETANWGIEPAELWGKINTEIDGSHLSGISKAKPGIIEDFTKTSRDAILDNAELNVTATQAMNTIKIIEAALKSEREKRTIEFD